MSSERQSTEPRASYWNAKIRKWAGSSYTKERGDVMSRLRSSIDARKDEAKKILRQYAGDGYTLLDLGCGAGQFVIEAVKDCGAARAVGVDFSSEAIGFANELRDDAGLAPEQAAFQTARTGDPWPEAQIVTGLGLLDWLDEKQIEELFSRLAGKKFLLSYSEQDNSFDEIVHRFYLVYRLKFFGKGVRAYHHRRGFILGLVEKYQLGPVEIVSAPGMRFGRLVHNLK